MDQNEQNQKQKYILADNVSLESRRIAGCARDTISLKYADIDHALEHKWKELSFVLTGAGEEAAPGWLSEKYKQAEGERDWYWRKKDGVFKRERIVSKTGKGWRRAEFDFAISPIYSRGFLLAAEAGLAALAKQFLVKLGQFTISVIKEETSGMEVLALPMHIKAEALHPQPSWTGWSSPVASPDGRSKLMACLKIGGPDHPNRLFSYLGRSMLGAKAQHEMELPLDELTGRQDAIGGVNKTLKKKSDVNLPLDVRVRTRLDAWIANELKRPEFRPLLPHMKQSKAIYLAHKDEQLALITSMSTDSGALAEAVDKLAAERKLRKEQEEARIAAEAALATERQARESERVHRAAAELTAAALVAENKVWAAKAAAAEVAHAEAMALGRQAFEGEKSLRAAADAREAALKVVSRDLVAKCEGVTLENTRLLKVVKTLVRRDLFNGSPGGRSALQIVMDALRDRLPKDLVDFENVNKKVGHLPIDTAIETYARHVNSPEAVELLRAMAALEQENAPAQGREPGASLGRAIGA